MSREIGPWKFVVNCLFPVEEPIKINNEFWEITYLASESIKNNFSNIKIIEDHYSLESVLYCHPHVLNVNTLNKTVEVDRNKCDVNCLNNIVNYSLDKNIKEKLPSLMKEVYDDFVLSKQILERKKFIEGLERASEIVASWPEWKQNVLGSSIYFE